MNPHRIIHDDLPRAPACAPGDASLSINALTLIVSDMERATAFYSALGFPCLRGGARDSFTTFAVGPHRLNLQAACGDGDPGRWGRVIFHVSDVDVCYRQMLAAGLTPRFAPRDASWGERYFHIRDPDGHELSFAEPHSASGRACAHRDRGGRNP